MKKQTFILGSIIIAGSMLLHSCNSNTSDNADAKVVPIITTDSTINNEQVPVTDSLASKEKNEKEENEKDEKK